jgi:tight adherence protein C
MIGLASLQWEPLGWAVLVALWGLYGWFRLRASAEPVAGAFPSLPGAPRGLARRLRQAGIPAVPAAKMQFWAARVFCACLLAFLVLTLFAIRSLPPSVPSLVIPLLLGALLPDLLLSLAIRRRRAEVRRGLSFLLDLVVALLRAGLPLDRALFRAARDGFPDGHPLADEVQAVEGEVGAGKDRGLAWYALADRTGVDELRTLAAALHVGLRAGAPVEDMLEAQADLLRDRRREEAVRRINASAALSIIPVLLCGLPVFAVVVYFPAFMEILETLRSIRLY